MKKKYKILLRHWIIDLYKLGVFALVLLGCQAEEPIKEDIPELITKVTLTFDPGGGISTVTASATDPDGDGVQDIAVDGVINLSANTNYTLTLSLINELAEISSPEYDITDEVAAEGDEHMFYYGWTENVFSNPSGDGNLFGF